VFNKATSFVKDSCQASCFYLPRTFTGMIQQCRYFYTNFAAMYLVLSNSSSFSWSFLSMSALTWVSSSCRRRTRLCHQRTVVTTMFISN